MAVLNAVLAGCVEGLLYPVRHQPPLVGLTLVSLLSAVAALAIVRLSSDQIRISKVKRQLEACVFEIRLFSDDGRAIMRALGEMVRHSMMYLRLCLVPALWISVPVGLLIGHLHVHYGYDGLEPGQPALIKLHASPDRAASVREFVLTAPPGLRIDTPALWIPSLNEAVWRIVPERSGSYAVTLHLGETTFLKTVEVSTGVVRLSPVRGDARVTSQLAYPAEPPLPRQAGIDAITVTYPRRGISILGREFHWLVVYLALSTVFGLVLKRPLNVAL
jgi:hypothetical protein